MRGKVRKGCLVLFVLICVMVIGGFKEEKVNAAEGDFVVDEDGMLIQYHGLGGDVVIPEEVGSTKVRGIGVFADNSTIQSVTIPETATFIHDEAFARSSLTSIIIPDSVVYLGDEVFYSCRNLVTIGLPDSIVYIGDRAFSECFSLTDFKIPKNITKIEKETFSYSGLKSIEISNRIKSIGDEAFFTVAI